MPRYYKYTTPKTVNYTAQGFEPNSITFDFETRECHIAFDEVARNGGQIDVVDADKVITLTTAELLALFNTAQLTLLRDKAVQAVTERTGDTGADETF